MFEDAALRLLHSLVPLVNLSNLSAVHAVLSLILPSVEPWPSGLPFGHKNKLLYIEPHLFQRQIRAVHKTIVGFGDKRVTEVAERLNWEQLALFQDVTQLKEVVFLMCLLVLRTEKGNEAFQALSKKDQRAISDRVGKEWIGFFRQ